MADEMNREEDLSFQFPRSVRPASHYSKRDPAGAQVQPSGLVDFNVNGSEQLLGLATSQGLSAHEFCVRTGGNMNTGLVGVYAVREGAEGATPVRRNDNNTYTIYLHGLFADYPQLRPEGARDCKVVVRNDASGVPCLVINLKGGLPKRRGNRSSEGSGAQ